MTIYYSERVFISLSCSSPCVFGFHRRESSLILGAGLIHAYNIVSVMISRSLIMCIVFITFVGTGGLLNPQRVFTTLSLVQILRLTSGLFLARSIVMLSEASVAESRIKVRCICNN